MFGQPFPPPEGRCRWKGPLSDYGNTVRRIIEALSAIRIEDYYILDAHPEFTGEIEAGLNAEGSTRLQRGCVPGNNIRRLMPIKPDAVAQPMRKIVTIARFYKVVSRYRI